MNINKLISRTGFKKDETQKAFGFLGIVMLVFSFFVASCNKNGIKEPEKEVKPSDSAATGDTGSSFTTLYNLEKTTSDITLPPNSFNKKNCGPTPGYPCGTKYYTVSPKDFKLG